MSGWLSEARVFILYENIKKIYSGILATRPYSWANSVLIGVGAHVLVTKQLAISQLLILTIILSFLMWIAGLTVLEFFHKKFEYDEKFPRYVLSVAFLVLLIISTMEGIHSAIAIAVFAVGLFLYSGKTFSKLGRVSFLFRGFLEVSLIWLILIFHGISFPSSEHLVYMGGIYSVTGSRNLIGDIRDRKVDEFTLPVTRPKLSLIISLGLGIGAGFLYPDLLTILPILTVLVITIILGINNAGKTHRIYILATLFFVLNIILKELVPELLIVTSIIFIGVLLNFTYWQVPRKQDKI